MKIKPKQISTIGANPNNGLRWDGYSWTSDPLALGDDSWYGDGSDGYVAINSDTTLTRDMIYQNLTIAYNKTIFTDGFRIIVRDTLINNGTISRNGISGTTGSAVGASALPRTTRPCGGSQQGGNGSIGNGLSPPDPGVTYAFIGGFGGAGGNAPSYTGGVGGTLTSAAAPRALPLIIIPANTSPASTSWCGGCGGGGGASSGGGGGGGGGSGGGVILLLAKTIINNGTISAVGGNGAQALTSDIRGGGGGGGGGLIQICCRTLSNNGTITVAGGSGGLKFGTGATDGVAGAIGTIIIIYN